MAVLLSIMALSSVSGSIGKNSRSHIVDFVVGFISSGLTQKFASIRLAELAIFGPTAILDLELLSLFVYVGNVLLVLRIAILLLDSDFSLIIRVVTKTIPSAISISHF